MTTPAIVPINRLDIKSDQKRAMEALKRFWSEDGLDETHCKPLLEGAVLSSENVAVADLLATLLNPIVKLAGANGPIYIYQADRSLWSKSTPDALCLLMSRVGVDRFEAVERAFEKHIRESRDEDFIRRAKGNLKSLRCIISKLRRHNFLASTKHSLMSIIYDSDTEFSSKLEGHPGIVAVRKNLVIDLRTGAVSERKRENYFTCELKAEWKDNVDLSRVERFMSDIMLGREDMVDYLQRLLGYCLTGETKEEKFFVFWGGGSNGKSSLMNLLRNLMGEFYGTASQDVMLSSTGRRSVGAASPHMVELKGKRLTVFPECENEAKLNMANIKKLTGRDAINCRPLYGDPISFVPTTKLILLTNNKPECDVETEGDRRRLVFVPFTARFIDQPAIDNDYLIDRDIVEKLSTEEGLSALLCWLVRGAQKWYREGLGEPPQVTAATQEFIQQQDILSQFVEEKCILDPDSSIRASVLYAAYSQWCGTLGLKAKSNKIFGEQMGQRYDKRKKSGYIYYHGLSLQSCER